MKTEQFVFEETANPNIQDSDEDMGDDEIKEDVIPEKEIN